ncbi:DUF4296 domain-containing protein [Lacinutrix sp. WUR7]|uniref:DUF4296 domain-containing protein n=1 Tax=Lacinutrix sp. WUR7 TaxID=2653681 RepID=UPI00193E58E6|nr:DUF4296 domain-containing protein [Lacinutrix sp. WUR7]QRM88363.1 DUF4296 domain-containing protein [Lacinutrix sp. WUR7]
MRNFLYAICVLLLVSCYSQHKPKKPKNLLSKEQMVDIIIGVSLYNSAKGVNKKVLERNGVKLQEHIYKKHKIDSAQFADSNYYYTYHPEVYEEIYNIVRDSLKKLKEKHTAIDKEESKLKRKKDSIKRAKLKSMP